MSEWQAHEQLILASATATVSGKRLYATGGNDNCVAIWDIGDCTQAPMAKSTSSDGMIPSYMADSILNAI